MPVLRDRVCVVTGVASGIGAAIAEEFAAEGARVIGCDIKTDGVELKPPGLFVAADVTSEVDMRKVIETAIERYGRLDVMVNNAAIELERELLETSEEQFDAIMSVNLKGVFFGCREAVAAMRDCGSGGSIINIASILALVGDGMLTAYCAAKAGVLGLTRAVAVQYAREGIRCNAICPGDVDTPMVQSYFAAFEDAGQRRREVEAHYPMQRIAQPREIARLAVYLASDDSSFINGQPIVVDGGLTAKCY
jgi:NAD(P)-dependent dehydrogenase (short-subunit alcohol dehydrogenase family)